MIVADRSRFAYERRGGVGAACVAGSFGESGVEIIFGVRFARNLKIAVADHVEQDHRGHLIERRRSLLAGLGISHVLLGAPGPVLLEGPVTARLLGVEQGNRNRRAVERSLGGEHAGQLENHCDA